MKRWLWLVAGLGLLATACQIQPLEDPGLGPPGIDFCCLRLRRFGPRRMACRRRPEPW